MKGEIGNCQRLQHMWDAIAKILKFTDGISYEQFVADDRNCAAVAHYFTVLGEAANRVTAEFRANHSEVPWTHVVGLRNVVVHEYFDVDYSVMWDTIQHDLKPLLALLKPIVDALPAPPPLPQELEELEGRVRPLCASGEAAPCGKGRSGGANEGHFRGI